MSGGLLVALYPPIIGFSCRISTLREVCPHLNQSDQNFTIEHWLSLWLDFATPFQPRAGASIQSEISDEQIQRPPFAEP